MKNLTFPSSLAVIALSALALASTGCGVSSSIQGTRQHSVSHEHLVHLPAMMYTPGSGNVPLLEKKGDLSLGFDVTHSGNNDNNDLNHGGNPANLLDQATHQTAGKVRTLTAKGAYALTDRTGLTVSVTAGSKKEMYRPYLEVWDVTTTTYQNDYWVWLPETYWWGDDGYSWDEVVAQTQINEYRKFTNDLTRRYRYFDLEVGVGRFARHGKVKTELYGGLGMARNTFDGHLDRGGQKEVYGRQDAVIYKAFAQPAVALSARWLEMGLACKASLLHYRLREARMASTDFASERDELLFLEPSVFLRVGPPAFRIALEQKWLAAAGKSPFPTNKSFMSVGVISMLSVL